MNTGFLHRFEPCIAHHLHFPMPAVGSRMTAWSRAAIASTAFSTAKTNSPAAKTTSTASKASGVPPKLRPARLRGIRRPCLIIHLKESERRWNHRQVNLYRLLLKTLRSQPLESCLEPFPMNDRQRLNQTRQQPRRPHRLQQGDSIPQSAFPSKKSTSSHPRPPSWRAPGPRAGGTF